MIAPEKHKPSFDPDVVTAEVESITCPKQINEAVSILDIREPDPSTSLLGDRFLSKGGSLLVVGPTNVGKSTLLLQASICWGCGRGFFDIMPSRTLKILMIQAENDDGAIVRAREGIISGLKLSQEERHLIEQNFLVYKHDGNVGEAFVDNTLEPAIKEYNPDVVIIDPAFSFFGGDVSSNKDVSLFLRQGIQSVLSKHPVGIIICHHTNKPGGSRGDAYSAAGAAEWANWARSILNLSGRCNSSFTLEAVKGQDLIGWPKNSQTGGHVKHIQHSKDRIFWEEVSEQARQVKSGSSRMEPKLDRVLHAVEVLPSDHAVTHEEWTKLYAAELKKEPESVRSNLSRYKKKASEKGWITVSGRKIQRVSTNH